jgi:flagellar basal-body rod protein FlgF
MIRGLYTAISGMITQEAKQQVISNNLANADTNGYKTDNLATKKFDDVLIENYDKVVNGKNVKNIIGSLSLGSQIDGTDKSFEQGVLQATTKSTDFAIDGRGFFTVGSRDQLGNIKNFYTRDGSFHVDSSGYLAASGGEYVMGTNLKTNLTEPIKVNDSKITCDANNNISLDGKLAYKLNVTDFNNYSSLNVVGDNLYDGGTPNNNQNISVKQMALEKSNVNVTNEMINMMTVLREYESNQKVVQAMDETLGRAVNDLGTVK